MIDKNKKLFWYYIKRRSKEIPEEFDIRIITEDYETLFETTVQKEDFKLFIKIMNNDKFALLNKDHELLGKASDIKIQYPNPILPKMEIVSSDIEKLINDYNNL